MARPTPECWGEVLPELPEAVLVAAFGRRLDGWGYGGAASWDSRERERWIYFVQGSDGGPIKIGMTKKAQWRASEIQSGYPFGILRYVGLVLGDGSQERKFHRRFFESRLMNEWFRPTPELVGFVRSLPAGGW